MTVEWIDPDDEPPNRPDLPSASACLREAAYAYEPAQWLQVALARLGWSQKEFAEEIDENRQAVSFWVRGKRIPGTDTRKKFDELADSLEGTDE